MAFIGDPECDLAWFITLDKNFTENYGLSRLEGTPSSEEIVQRYEELTGWQVRNLFYNEVMATLRLGLAVIAVLKKFQKQGIPIEDDSISNNFSTQHIADLLGLPSPGDKKQEITSLEGVTVTVQFHFTGPAGCDWYLVSDKGTGTRYEGVADRADCTIRVSVEDWKAIQSGELNQLDAWSTGKLVAEGHLGLLSLLEDMMAKFSF
jgi:putative sterol carrier protein